MKYRHRRGEKKHNKKKNILTNQMKSNMLLDIPQGNGSEDLVTRRNIIANFYREWKI